LDRSSIGQTESEVVVYLNFSMFNLE